MKLVQLLVVAAIIMVACLGGLGGWLLPQLGIEGAVAQSIAAAIGGVLIGIVYLRMKRADGPA